MENGSSTCRFACKEFEAYNEKDAIRLALYYCWQWGEEFFAGKAPKAIISKSKDEKASSPTPAASAKSTNPTSPPSSSKQNLALHPINPTFASCRATILALRLLPNPNFLCNFVMVKFLPSRT